MKRMTLPLAHALSALALMFACPAEAQPPAGTASDQQPVDPVPAQPPTDTAPNQQPADAAPAQQQQPQDPVPPQDAQPQDMPPADAPQPQDVPPADQPRPQDMPPAEDTQPQDMPPADQGPLQDATADDQETNYPDAWFRFDTDGLGTQFWVGATHDLGGGVGLGSDIYVVGTVAELDVGVAFSVGPVSLLPMAGIAFDFALQETVSLVAPQLFTIIDIEPVYFESWIQVFFNDMFLNGTTDFLYTRDFILLKLCEMVHLGPQLELQYDFNNAPGDELAALPIGGRTNVVYGENNTLGLFLGYDIQTEGLAGRFTFIRTW